MGWRIGPCHCSTVRRRILTDFWNCKRLSCRYALSYYPVLCSWSLNSNAKSHPCVLRRTRLSSSEKVRCACHDPHKHRTIHMDFVSIPTYPSFRCLDDDKVTSTLPLASNRYPHETESYSLVKKWVIIHFTTVVPRRLLNTRLLVLVDDYHINVKSRK